MEVLGRCKPICLFLFIAKQIQTLSDKPHASGQFNDLVNSNSEKSQFSLIKTANSINGDVSIRAGAWKTS